MAGIQDRFSKTNELLFLAREKTKSLQTGVAIETKVRNQLGGQQPREKCFFFPCWFKPAVINGPAKMLLTQIGAKKWRGKDAHMFFQFQFISDTILQRLATGTISI